MRRAWAVAVKELRQIRRDRRTLLILLFIPAFFLFLYGYALNFDIRHVSLAVEDRDGSTESRTLIARFVQSTYFDLVASVASKGEADRLMDTGEVRALLVIPDDFSRRLREGGTGDVQVILNGDNANTATTVLGYISTITAVLSTALSIVREKEMGTMEQVRMAPISTPAFVLGKTLPYLIISQISAMLIVATAMVLFQLPMRGSWLSLAFVLALFLVGGVGTGLLVSTVTDTQQIALQISMLIAFLPTMILSGFIFPISSMPVPIQYVTTIVPARYFLVALRGIVLKGLSLTAVWPSLLALGLYALAVLGISSARLAQGGE
jgi:ABC-2 type transport system permease protein